MGEEPGQQRLVNLRWLGSSLMEQQKAQAVRKQGNVSGYYEDALAERVLLMGAKCSNQALNNCDRG